MATEEHDLIDDEIDEERQNKVDGAIFELVRALAPKNADKIKWDTGWVNELSFFIMDVIVNQYQCCTESEFVSSIIAAKIPLSLWPAICEAFNQARESDGGLNREAHGLTQDRRNFQPAPG